MTKKEPVTALADELDSRKPERIFMKLISATLLLFVVLHAPLFGQATEPTGKQLEEAKQAFARLGAIYKNEFNRDKTHHAFLMPERTKDEDMKKLHRVRAELQEQYPLKRGKDILAVLQIENDTQILYFSPYRNMDEFIADVEAMYPTGRIIARPHPRSSAKRSFQRARVRSGGAFLEAASRAGVVVGITSTCLYEAAILGVPVVALGDHPLRLQPKHLHERVLAGVLALRIERETGDLGPILERFGIRPL